MSTGAYATLPKAPAQDDDEGGGAGLAALARMTDREFEASEHPAATLGRVVFSAALVAAGGLARHFVAVPAAWEAAAASGLLAAWAVRTGLRRRRAGSAEPPWAAAARARQAQDLDRLPEGTRQAVEAALRRVAGSTRLEVFLYTGRCAQQGPHYGLCHTGASAGRHGRAVIMAGEHLLTGEEGLLALPVLAHEGRHFTGWRYWAFALAAAAGSYGMLIAGWAVPWPQVIVAVIALRLLAVTAARAVEAACDIGGARATSAEAMVAFLQYRERARRSGRAAWPRRKRAAAALAAAFGTAHPPAALRCRLVRALAG